VRTAGHLPPYVLSVRLRILNAPLMRVFARIFRAPFSAPCPWASASPPYTFPDPPAKGPTTGLVYQLKIRLVGVEHSIWRRIQVSALYTFWDLHVAITDAMGWHDYHLHLFSVQNPDTGRLDPIGLFDDSDPDGPDCLPDFMYRIAGYFLNPGDRAW
jgi:hypothetical protein